MNWHNVLHYHLQKEKIALLSLFPCFVVNYKPKSLDAKYPKVLTECFNKNHTTDSPSELKDYVMTVFEDLRVSDEEV